jgi:heterodisulfide reductase subunit C
MMNDHDSNIAVDTALIENVAQRAGDSIYNCYQCNKCSSGCPAAEFMDFLPAEIIRMVQLGLKDQILSSTTIWVCSSCETCTTRCPNEVDIAMVMDVMREKCIESGKQPSEVNVLNLHRTFLSTIKRFGKLHELGLILGYKLKSKKYFDDLILGFNMFRKGKIKLFPARIKQIKEMRKILAGY